MPSFSVFLSLLGLVGPCLRLEGCLSSHFLLRLPWLPFFSRGERCDWRYASVTNLAECDLSTVAPSLRNWDSSPRSPTHFERRERRTSPVAHALTFQSKEPQPTETTTYIRHRLWTSLWAREQGLSGCSSGVQNFSPWSRGLPDCKGLGLG